MRRSFVRSTLEKNVDTEVYELELPPVLLSNPKAKEYNMVRTTLIPGLLKTLDKNTHNPLPIRLFEVSDICIQDKRTETVTSIFITYLFIFNHIIRLNCDM